MIQKLLGGELRRGALILLVTMNIYNILNFIFHFIMGRMLGPTDYGVLVVLMSFIYIFSIPSEAIQNLVSKYTSKFNLKKENGKIKYLLNSGLKQVLSLGIVIFLILGLFSIFVSIFLKINIILILITNLFIFLSLSSPIIRGIFQGKKEFFRLGSNMILESFLKLFFSISGVLFGFKIFGAIGGVLIGVLGSIIIGISLEKDILKSNKKEVKIDTLKKDLLNYFVAMFVVLAALSLDIILARRFFSPDIAGKYAVLSMLGKIIFFGTGAVGKAMFPLTSERQEKKENHLEVFLKSLVAVIILCSSAILIYLFFPELVIKTLYGVAYLEMAEYLVYSGIALSFLSLTNLTLIYSLSSERIKKSYLLVVFLVLEIILLSIYNQNVKEYILAFMFSNIVMFIGSLFFLIKWRK